MATAMKPRRGPQGAAAPGTQLGWGTHLVTVLLATWLIGGVFVDGWAHNNLANLETFFTPWHAMLYSGFAATAIWMTYTVARHVRPHGGLLTPAGRAAIPAGYSLGLLGVIIFALGGLGDMWWHIVFGIERDIATLLSPTHLMLFTGAFLVLTTPLRAAWVDARGSSAPSFRVFFPTLLSLTLTTAVMAFMWMDHWALRWGNPEKHMQELYQGLRSALMFVNLHGVDNFILSNLILFAPLLLVMRRWRLPFGTVTFLFTVVATLMQALDAFHSPEVVVGCVVLGLVGDLLVRLMQVTPERVGAYRLFATAMPVLVWGAYFAVVGLEGQLGWAPELWGGVLVWTGLSGLGLTLLTASAVPQAK